jgi:hypothetical protein
MKTAPEPKLAPPGAGLPVPELYLARLFFVWRRFTGNRDAFNARFQRERELIRALVRSFDRDSGSRRVLIARPRGLEDSSRYWSLWMTLDHLRIIHYGMTRIIDALMKGVAPERQVSTAAVKPSPEASAAVAAEYEKSCDELVARTMSGDLKTNARHAHPWFGPLDAAGWHALAAGHIGIHRVQIERILKGLHTEQPPA